MDDDHRLPGEIAAAIAEDDSLDDMTAIRKLLALVIDQQDTEIHFLIEISEALGLRTVKS